MQSECLNGYEVRDLFTNPGPATCNVLRLIHEALEIAMGGLDPAVPSTSERIDRICRDAWSTHREAIVRRAATDVVDGSLLGDSAHWS